MALSRVKITLLLEVTGIVRNRLSPMVYSSAALPGQKPHRIGHATTQAGACGILGHAPGMHDGPDWENLMSHYQGQVPDVGLGEQDG